MREECVMSETRGGGSPTVGERLDATLVEQLGERALRRHAHCYTLLCPVVGIVREPSVILYARHSIVLVIPFK